MRTRRGTRNRLRRRIRALRENKLRVAVGLLIAAGVVAVGSLFFFTSLPVEGEPAFSLPPRLPPTVRGVSLQAIEAGRMESLAALSYRGGGLMDKRIFGMGAILVQHPKGKLLFDTGFGKDVDAHFKTTPKLMQWTSTYAKEATVAEQLATSGIGLKNLSIILTHAHWDHVSGIPDLRGVPVYVSPQERAFIDSGDEMTALMRSLSSPDLKSYQFTNMPYLGFEQSLDWFGDGSVVLVPAGGHTPGSIIAFVRTDGDKSYALIGDLAWQKEGIELPAERPLVSRRIVDKDEARVRELIVWLHKLQAANTGLVIVPAHDRRVWDALPKLSS